jgi:hypothetical protein
MRTLWTLLKVGIGLAIAIPLGIIAIILAFGILGTLLGLATLALKIVCLVFVVYACVRVARYFIGGPPAPQRLRELPKPDPYLDAAMHEVDSHIGRSGR